MPIPLVAGGKVMWVRLNDRLVPESEAVVSVFDRGFMYGDGVFETIRLYRGRPFRPGCHIDRFEASAAALQLRLPRSRAEILRDIEELLEPNGLTGTDAVVRLALSRGVGVRGPSIRGADNPTYVATVGPLPPDLARRRTAGVRLKIVSTRRVNADALPVHAKHANYLNSILAHAEAVESGADDALLLSANGRLAECSGSNLFLVNGSRILTPDLKTGILPGCARAVVLELCGRNRLSADQARLDPAVLHEVEEVFITNSVTGIVPVASVDGRAFDSPGPVTSILTAAYDRLVDQELFDGS